MNRFTERQQTDKHTKRLTDRFTDRQIDGRTDGQTDKITDGEMINIFYVCYIVSE